MALGIILGTPCGSAIGTGNPPGETGWGVCGLEVRRPGGDGGAGSRLELREVLFSVCGCARGGCVWALRPPRR